MDLAKGRISVPHARYFVTLCAKRVTTEWTHPALGPRLVQTIAAVYNPPDATLLCATIMPDHLHLLFELGSRLPLDRLLAKFKTVARRQCANDVSWQRNFYEHRLRPDESAEDVARYVFLNPYRKQLVRRTQAWPYWQLGSNADFDFLHLLEAGQYPPEAWLAVDFRPPFLHPQPPRSVRANSAPTKTTAGPAIPPP
jgi:REP element-mobilizing transposase RayT